MGGINTGRWLAGGIAAAVTVFLLEGVASLFYREEMEAALAAIGMTMDMSGASWYLAILVSLILGLVIVFFYAAVRPRFGPGPVTAIKVAIGLWFGSTLLSLIGYGMVGLYPTGLLVKWGIIGLFNMVLSALVGGWVYREA